MPLPSYTASKTRAQGRPGWTVSFRHPLRNDPKGKPGLKMRRGLGTTEADEADRLVAEMNTILSEPAWWSATKKPEAERRFSPVITAAFFDEIQAGRVELGNGYGRSTFRFPKSATAIPRLCWSVRPGLAKRRFFDT